MSADELDLATQTTYKRSRTGWETFRSCCAARDVRQRAASGRREKLPHGQEVDPDAANHRQHAFHQLIATHLTHRGKRYRQPRGVRVE